MEWLIKIALLKDRFFLILLSFVKIGIIRVNGKQSDGFSFVIGLYKFECQLYLSKVKPIEVWLDEAGRA
ncbi:MAG: hypothetical protein Tp132SUR00d2C45923861_51 [Prokaryotic dsDNA virus sp.]|nr:MAG: hypothetical protein Tp132SUR00d2C45923861_51 [Prokaryotic dsDNA virus sp.]|tara:strand:+ start:47841 stop:48047 length:207 start_codon:yes stop_codon:yes gene_type:complete